jgi:hypothetical protein
MWTAARSSRTSMILIPSASRRIQIGMMWPPHKAKTRSIPRVLSSRAMHPAALSAESFIIFGYSRAGDVSAIFSGPEQALVEVHQ